MLLSAPETGGWIGHAARPPASTAFAPHFDVEEADRPQRPANDLVADLAYVAGQEDERLRISMELHDSTSQHLVAIALGLARLRRIVDGDHAEDVMQDMSHAIGEVVKEIRVLSYLMRPESADSVDLEDAIRTFVRGFATRTGLDAGVSCIGGLDSASPSVRHAVYRIVQEALANVYRHAGARRAEVRLSSDGETLSLCIADDGRGIAAIPAGDFQPGVGVAGMRTRAAQLKGRLEIVCPNRGLEVRVELPLRANAD